MFINNNNIMMRIFESATRLVLLLLSAALVTLTFMGIVDAKDFMSIVTMVFAFYFGQKVTKK